MVFSVLSCHLCDSSVTSFFFIHIILLQAGHSVYPDSPLGPDAFLEYGSLLTQDYEELMKKYGIDSSLSRISEPKDGAASEEEGWAELTSFEDDVSGSDSISTPKMSSKIEDIEQKLMVSVHHFPLMVCPLSSRVFVLPSEGSIAEACLSTEHENSISSGLPPLSTGKLSDTEDVSAGAALTAQFLYHWASKVRKSSGIYSCEINFSC